MKTFVIAEAGANHNQNLDQAKKLIDVAAEAGAASQWISRCVVGGQ